jgi:outer membrane protein OmpA-like peptidoglycan-associated protein
MNAKPAMNLRTLSLAVALTMSPVGAAVAADAGQKAAGQKAQSAPAAPAAAAPVFPTIPLPTTATPVFPTIPLPTTATPVFPTVPVPVAPPASINQEEWVNRMTDFTRNMGPFKDPKQFMPMFQAVTEPGFYTTMGNVALDPTAWMHMMNSMVHPGAYPNMMQFVDPGVYLKWLGASLDPTFYNQLLAQLSDPAKIMRWSMLPMDPQFLNLLLQTLNPNLYMRWMIMPMDPLLWQFMGTAMNPATYMAWMNEAMKPGSYGDMWKGFLGTPVPYRPSGMRSSGVLGAPMNFFDPASLGQLFGMAGMPAPTMPTPSAAPAGTFNPLDPATWAQAITPAVPAAVAPAKAAEKLTLSADAVFKFGTSGLRDMSAEGKKSLDGLADKIKDAKDIEAIVVTGHADTMGKADFNKRLSENRAKSVRAYLVSRGVKRELIKVVGEGSAKPMAICDANLPRDKRIECEGPNRRVEVEIKRKTK